ncbi:MAG: endonuclease/exonuclease/phosphatase family protein [Akkermansiaceae bacterium]
MSPRHRFAALSGIAILLFGSLWVLHSTETPPWKSSEISANPNREKSYVSNKKTKDAEPDPFRFLSYNVKNWLVSDQSPEKSTESKDAVILLISSAQPDVVGLCEIGSENDLKEVQSKLTEKGLELPYLHHTGGSDPIRHLGLLSRFPIVSTVSPKIKIPNTDHFIQRGILDATVRIGDAPVRFIGVHLKSKRTVPTFDQATLRVAESQTIRKHIDEIFLSDQSAKLIVYGDFNDHIRSLSTRTILGKYRTAEYLMPVSLKDSHGENWTHLFATHDSYSRIDFITVSPSLRSNLKRSESRIIDESGWQKASDHRPLLVAFE